MERGESSHGYPRNSKSSSALTTIVETGNSNTTTNNNNNNRRPRLPPVHMREPEQYMPIANVIRIMRRVLPPYAKISDDAKETVQECVSEYISFITSEANERCHREHRKTVTADDLLWAMGRLGFNDYVENLIVFLNRYRQPEAEQASVRGEPLVRRMVDIGVVGPVSYPMAFPVGVHRGMADALATNAASMNEMDGFHGDVSGASGGGGSSEAALARFHPY